MVFSACRKRRRLFRYFDEVEEYHILIIVKSEILFRHSPCFIKVLVTDMSLVASITGGWEPPQRSSICCHQEPDIGASRRAREGRCTSRFWRPLILGLTF